MAYAIDAISAGELNAYNADNQMVVGHNVLRDAIDLRWTLGGTQAEADITSPVGYPYRVYDGRGTVPTFSGPTGATNTVYFNAQIPPSTLDTGALIFLAEFGLSEVTLQIANAGTFGGGDAVLDIAGPFPNVRGNPRLAFTGYALGERYTGVEFLRIRFVLAAGNWNTTILPRLTELFLGVGRVFSIGWGFGSDLSPNHGEHTSFDAQSGEETRYIKYHSRHVEESSQVLSEASLDGLDDVATVRTLAEESLSFKRPLLYIPRPASAISRALLGFGPREGLDMPQTDYDAYEFRFPFREQPMYRKREAA